MIVGDVNFEFCISFLFVQNLKIKFDSPKTLWSVFFQKLIPHPSLPYSPSNKLFKRLFDNSSLMVKFEKKMRCEYFLDGNNTEA